MSQLIPMPPVEFQSLVCGPGSEHLFEAAGRGLRDLLRQHAMLTPGASVLDIGCGCGRLARYLLELPIGSYVGFDRHKGMVAWCAQEIGSRDPRFRFDYFDLKSVYTVWDDQAGAINTETFRFPYADSTFDSIVLGSVFTHMPPGETRQYLDEMARVMRPGGKALLSVFFSPTGATEVRDDGINVFHSLPWLLASISALPFDARFIGPAMPNGERPEPDQSFNYKHNWYLLTRSIAPAVA
jgi:SAM-dependent methyltransferase